MEMLACQEIEHTLESDGSNVLTDQRLHLVIHGMHLHFLLTRMYFMVQVNVIILISSKLVCWQKVEEVLTFTHTLQNFSFENCHSYSRKNSSL